MEVRPSIHDQHHGLGSWHPAMRPDTHDANHEKDRQTIEAYPETTAHARSSGENAPSIQSPVRPINSSEERLVSPSSPITDSQHADEALPHSEGEVGGNQKYDEGLTPEVGDARLLDSALDVDTTDANPADLLQVSEESTNEANQRTAPQSSFIVSNDKGEEVLDSTVYPSHVEEALGDKGEMERAWELEEENIPSNAVTNPPRSNSFPVVPLLQKNEHVPPHALPLSTVEGIIEEDESAEALDPELPSTALPPTFSDRNVAQDPFALIAEEENNDYFAIPRSQTATSIGKPEEESRYDEGVPLIQPSQSGTLDVWESHISGAEFQSPHTADGSHSLDLIGSESSEGVPFKPRPLDRKSTTQVLDSMHYAPHGVNHLDSQSVKDKSSLPEVTEEPTVKAQVLSETQADPPQYERKDEDLAELWKAALGEDDLLVEDEEPVNPYAFFDDDGEGFLEGRPDQAADFPQHSTESVHGAHAADDKMRELGGTHSRPALNPNKYMPATASQSTGYQTLQQGSSSLNHSFPAPLGTPNATGYPSYTSQAPPRPQMPASTQSFADKAKGGYTSPYDLPMDVTRPKKRTTFQQMHPGQDLQSASSRPPPPRSSSMFTGVPQHVQSQPPMPRLPNHSLPTTNGNPIPPSLKASSNMGSFFEELKPSSRPRPSSSMGRFVPPANQPMPSTPLPVQQEPSRQSSLPPPLVSRPTGSLQPYQLLPPERISLYSNGNQAEPASQTVTAVNARYSPAPPPKPNASPSSSRYVASPSIGGRPQPSQTLPFQPRTSSPLAQATSLPPQHHQGSMSDPSLRRPRSSGVEGSLALGSGATNFSFPSRPSLQNIDQGPYQSGGTGPLMGSSQLRQSPSHTQLDSMNNLVSDPANNVMIPDTQIPFQSDREVSSSAPKASSHGPLRRSQTSSPGVGQYIPEAVSAQIPYQRPASVNHSMTSPSAEARLPISTPMRPRGNTLSKDLNYVRPTDGRELDPLERWKGSPIFCFGFGGAIVTSFPAQVPRYAAGQAAPMIKCSPGEIRLRDGKILPLEDDLATFPGPLKSKGKKKDVLDWLQRRILTMGQNLGGPASSATLPDLSKRHEEKIILWNVVRVLVENDGVIDGSPTAEKAIRSLLSPELTQGDEAHVPSQSSAASLVGITRHSGSRSILDLASPDAMEALRKLLLHGEREKAVWHAVDHRLWAHAMLLSSTLDKSVWRQVSQEFVRQEVRSYGDNTEALAALYQTFAGNGSDSADELVPPSARAGLQMVSKVAGNGPTKNALDGLDRWRETLTLILSNRSPDDGNALINLGRLLANYGRTEAAHTCYVSAKLPGLFGGPDDPQVSVALLGADHIRHPVEYSRDLDSILLTEVYDFSQTILASSSAATVSPHLQSFKLYHAMILAEHGYKAEAQQYCEVITNTLNSTTKRSPYYHNLLLGALDSLVERLRQAPKDSSGSWISKPSIDKVSGSLWAKFNQYVAGDESDAASTGSGKGRDAASGPFAGVAGDSPTLSRAPSSNDLYNSYAQGAGSSTALLPNPSISRYAPASLCTPRSSLEPQGRPLQDFQRPTQADTLRPAFSQQQYQSRPTSSTSSQQEMHKSTPPSTYTARTESYLPTPPSQAQYMPEPPPEEHSLFLYQPDSHQPTPPLEPQASHNHYQPQSDQGLGNGHQPPLSAYVPASSAYDETSTDDNGRTLSTGYDPPSYNTEVLRADESPVQEKPKKKSFMDDDEDNFEARAGALRREEKARKDREADEAFQRAAEADAQKDKAPKLSSKKSGWFGGWLGSKKEGEDAHGTPNAPIKAKLGEQSSFYYDAEKKRWVNKKDPDATPAATATPPPPRGPSSRAVSAPGPPPPSSMATPPVPALPASTGTPPITFTRPPLSRPPSQYPSRSPSPAVNPSIGQVTEAPAPAPGPLSGPPLAPPSRPTTAMSNASSIDDLIGVPHARKGGTIKKAKKKGYVDVMAK